MSSSILFAKRRYLGSSSQENQSSAYLPIITRSIYTAQSKNKQHNRSSSSRFSNVASSLIKPISSKGKITYYQLQRNENLRKTDSHRIVHIQPSFTPTLLKDKLNLITIKPSLPKYHPEPKKEETYGEEDYSSDSEEEYLCPRYK